MADFTRFISYLYDYRGGERNRNLGFVKVEVRQGMCRLTVTLNHGHVLLQDMSLCGYITEDGVVRLIRLGTMEKGEKDHQWRFLPGNLGGSGLGPEGLSGLILLSGDRELFWLTVWKDENLEAETIRRGEFWQKKNDAEKGTELRASENRDVQECPEVETGSSRNAEMKSAEPECTEMELTEMKPTESGSSESAPRGWRELCRLFPAARPFEPSVWEVLCISLQDIGRLPPENWVWGNNHFVLHRFYQYHHLVLARDRVENRVYLGIPGEFGTNETFLAAMFGLHRFERERKGKGETGYWLTPVSLKA